MPKPPTHLHVTPLKATSPTQVTPRPRVSTTMTEARVLRTPEGVALANPRLTATGLVKIRPSIVKVEGLAGFAVGDSRDKVTVPISPAPEPADSLLFEDPADARKKYYLPRYRLREQGGRYEIGVAAAPDGTWRLTVGLERYPAPELGAGAQGAAELPHAIDVFFRYGAGPSYAIEKTVDFREVRDDAKGLAIAIGLSLLERDGLLYALQTPAAGPKLVVRRAITVAVQVADQGRQQKPQVLVRDHRKVAMPAAGQPARMAFKPSSLNTAGGAQVVLPAAPARPPNRYRTIQRALDDVAEPKLFVLDPRLHPYLYEGASAGGGAAATEFRRIVVAHPQGSPDARFHTYLQDKAEPWVFYYLPDRFKLSRREVAPFLPQMVVRIAAPDGTIENASVTIDYVVEPWLHTARLAAAGVALKREVPATAHQAEPELRPLQAQASLKLWLPGSVGAALVDQKDVAIDLANGFVHSLTVPLDGFRQLYASAYSRDATSLFSGQVVVETGLSTPEPIPVEIRFADTQGECLAFVEQPADTEDTIAVRMQNGIESPLRIASLPVRVRRGDTEVAAAIEGLTFDAPLELAPGAEVAFVVRLQGALPGDGALDAVFDTSGVQILPDPEKILPLISDTSVPAEYERQVEVMTMPELLGDPADPASIILINVEFKGGANLKLSRDQLSGVAQVRLSLMDLLMGRDVQGKYGFRQQIIRRNGSQTVDPGWREADFSLLVLPAM
jgi:hypothetical protein